MARVKRGDHICFTCHPHTNHTYLYSPASRRHRPLAGTHKVWLGRVELSGRLHNEINIKHWELNPDTVTHPSTNRT